MRSGSGRSSSGLQGRASSRAGRRHAVGRDERGRQPARGSLDAQEARHARHAGVVPVSPPDLSEQVIDTEPGAVANPVSVGLGAQACIERTVAGLGFELVDVERSARGLLRVYMDRVPGRTYPEAQGAGEFVTVDDCELVTRQLQYLLEVEGVPYERLEVSSPGLDRRLNKAADYERFVGSEVTIALKSPFQGRKHWKGVLGQGPEGWTLALDGQHQGSQLEFKLEEVREARLVPVIDFKGRGRQAPGQG